MQALVFRTLIPTWRGLPLPLPWTVRLGLYLSLNLVDLQSLRRYGRTFRSISAARRELVLQALLDHRLAWVRSVARRWKQLALLTA